MKSEKTKEKIILHTIDLIKETNGEIENITIREIAKRAGIGIGLINHYFQSKDHLIEACVQTIISEVINSFSPNIAQRNDPIKNTKYTAKLVMDFLMNNRQISKVSILGDMHYPKESDNTMKTVFGFGYCLSGGKLTNEYKIKSFMITSVLQEVFLRKDTLKESFGIDLYNKKQRDDFIDSTIERFA